jgi:nucleoside phosphorylase
VDYESIDYLIFCAEKRELSPFLKNSKKINGRSYLKENNNKKILIIITGVGKNAVKRTLHNQQPLLHKITTQKIFNLGNAGSLKAISSSTILNIGKCSGSNGKESITIDTTSHIENITVNSLQNKKKLAHQFPNAYTIDMELFHLAKAYPNIKAYKIILDTFKINPKSFFFKLLLPIIIHKNSKLLYTFFIKNYCL